LAREFIYTARKFTPEEAKELGLVSKILDNEASLVNAGLDLAKIIASKSPIAVQGSKINLIYSRDHSVKDGLKFMTAWNGAMLQSEDLLKAAMASFSKETAKFSKL
jgi:delta(3,5)-delta(2,4)-dienoyl-CoA isomerase